MKHALLGVLCGMLFSLLLAIIYVPMMMDNAVHQERIKATAHGVGAYYLDTKDGNRKFQYLDLDAYTHYILGQIAAGRAVPVNPLKDTQ